MPEFDWHALTPSATLAAIADVDGAPAMVSGALLARHADAIDGPVLEMTATRGALLVGFLRACKQADAIAVVAVPGAVIARSPQAGLAALRGIAGAAAVARHDRPIVVVARARPRQSGDDDGALALAGDVADGFSAVALRAADVTDVDALLRASRLADDVEIGVELEIDDGDDAAFLLATLDDRGVPLAAVRGAGIHDDLGAAARVVDVDAVGALDGLDPGGLRVNVDSALASVTGSDDDVEVRAWLLTSRLLRALKATGSASRLALDIERRS